MAETLAILANVIMELDKATESLGQFNNFSAGSLHAAKEIVESVYREHGQ